MNDYQKKYADCLEFVKKYTDDNDSIKLLKGGSYKIKQYYLEDNDLNDIRGASTNLSYVEEYVVPDYIEKYLQHKFNASEEESKNCIIYNGGGNIFCILPATVDDNLTIELESEAQKYLVSTNTAYVITESTISEIEENYKKTMNTLEQKLADRKKLKVSINVNPSSAFTEQGYIPWKNGEKFTVDINPCKDYCECELCKTKTAKYIIHKSDNKINVCASCLHKRIIGQNAKSKYVDEYKSYGGSKKAIKCSSIQEIDPEYTAVVYGDGNNMGQIIQNFTHITQMMQFSDEVKTTSNKAVFQAMNDLSIQKFEVVGLGGDDVFVIVSGRVAMEFAVKLIQNYNNAFKKTDEEKKENANPYKSTMSVGVCIAKSKTPVRVMLEVAEEKLKEAKEIAKTDNARGCDTGSIAYVIMDNPNESTEKHKNKFGAYTTLQPYNTKGATELIDAVKKLGSGMNKTRIRNIYDAYCNADTEDEAYLFFMYQNAKNKVGISVPDIDGFTIKNGMYYRNDEKAFIWKDIIDLLDFVSKEGAE